MGEFLDWVHWNGKMNIKCSWVHSMVCGAGLNKKTKVELRTSLHFLLTDSGCCMTRCLSLLLPSIFCHDGWDSQTLRQNWLFAPYVAWSGFHNLLCDNFYFYLLTISYIYMYYIMVAFLPVFSYFFSHFYQLHSFLPNSFLYSWSFISYVDQGNRIEDSYISPCNYSYLIFYNEAKI